jgi:hypothetical protein
MAEGAAMGAGGLLIERTGSRGWTEASSGMGLEMTWENLIVRDPEFVRSGQQCSSG